MDNLRGSLFMVMAMAFFAVEDAFIKALSGGLPTGEVLIFVGLGGLAIFWGLLARKGLALWTDALRNRALLWRSLGEFVGAIGYVTALMLTPISSATAILMAAPLATVLGTALLGAPVGWRRWSAVALGFIGVLLVVQPGMAGFQPASLFAVVGVSGLVLRDLATPRVPAHIPSLQVSAAAYLGIVVAGVAMLAITGTAPVMPRAAHLLPVAAVILSGAAGYMAIVTATRIAELSVVMPFRYSRLLFAMIAGVVFFGERPDALTLTGSGIIMASGLYSIWREAQLRRAASPAPARRL